MTGMSRLTYAHHNFFLITVSKGYFPLHFFYNRASSFFNNNFHYSILFKNVFPFFFNRDFYLFFYTGISVAAYAYRLISGFIFLLLLLSLFFITTHIFFFHYRVSGLVYAHHDLKKKLFFFLMDGFF